MAAKLILVSFLLAGADVLSVQSQFVPTLPPPQSSSQPELTITEENGSFPADNAAAAAKVSEVQPKSIVISTTERVRFVPTLRPKKRPRTRSPVREVRITTTERVRFVPANGRRTTRTTRAPKTRKPVSREKLRPKKRKQETAIKEEEVNPVTESSRPAAVVTTTTERDKFVPTLRPKTRGRVATTRRPPTEIRITTTERVRFVPTAGGGRRRRPRPRTRTRQKQRDEEETEILPTVRSSTTTTTTEANIIKEETESTTYFPVSKKSKTKEESNTDQQEDELLITQFRKEIQSGNYDHAREILVSSNLTAADAALLLDIPKQQVEEILGISKQDRKPESTTTSTKPRQRTRQRTGGHKRPLLVKDIILDDYYDTDSGSGSDSDFEDNVDIQTAKNVLKVNLEDQGIQDNQLDENTIDTTRVNNGHQSTPDRSERLNAIRNRANSVNTNRPQRKRVESKTSDDSLAPPPLRTAGHQIPTATTVTRQPVKPNRRRPTNKFDVATSVASAVDAPAVDENEQDLTSSQKFIQDCFPPRKETFLDCFISNKDAFQNTISQDTLQDSFPPSQDTLHDSFSPSQETLQDSFSPSQDTLQDSFSPSQDTFQNSFIANQNSFTSNNQIGHDSVPPIEDYEYEYYYDYEDLPSSEDIIKDSFPPSQSTIKDRFSPSQEAVQDSFPSRQETVRDSSQATFTNSILPRQETFRDTSQRGRATSRFRGGQEPSSLPDGRVTSQDDFHSSLAEDFMQRTKSRTKLPPTSPVETPKPRRVSGSREVPRKNPVSLEEPTPRRNPGSLDKFGRKIGDSDHLARISERLRNRPRPAAVNTNRIESLEAQQNDFSLPTIETSPGGANNFQGTTNTFNGNRDLFAGLGLSNSFPDVQTAPGQQQRTSFQRPVQQQFPLQPQTTSRPALQVQNTFAPQLQIQSQPQPTPQPVQRPITFRPTFQPQQPVQQQEAVPTTPPFQVFQSLQPFEPQLNFQQIQQTFQPQSFQRPQAFQPQQTFQLSFQPQQRFQPTPTVQPQQRFLPQPTFQPQQRFQSQPSFPRQTLFQAQPTVQPQQNFRSPVDPFSNLLRIAAGADTKSPTLQTQLTVQSGPAPPVIDLFHPLPQTF